VLELRLLMKTLLLPPALQFLMLLLALALWRQHRGLARACALLSLLSLWLLSTPFVATGIAQSIEPPPLPRTDLHAAEADAIVILGAYLRFNADEFGDFVSSRHGVERLRYGAFLHRQLGLPIAISGGRLDADWERSLADYMAIELRDTFATATTWMETRSRSTAENALYSYEMLEGVGRTRILLVTHAMHMRRAQWVFERAGFEVVPAPTAYVNGWRLTLKSAVPSASALAISSEALHEILGYYYYRLRALF
jgi:uncharacterized SAM-binding protein YcdF (DUF218 family)